MVRDLALLPETLWGGRSLPQHFFGALLPHAMTANKVLEHRSLRRRPLRRSDPRFDHTADLIPGCAAAVSGVLRENRMLQSLDLSALALSVGDRRVSLKEAEAVGDALSANTTLRFLALGGLRCATALHSRHMHSCCTMRRCLGWCALTAVVLRPWFRPSSPPAARRTTPRSCGACAATLRSAASRLSAAASTGPRQVSVWWKSARGRGGLPSGRSAVVLFCYPAPPTSPAADRVSDEVALTAAPL